MKATHFTRGLGLVSLIAMILLLGIAMYRLVQVPQTTIQTGSTKRQDNASPHITTTQSLTTSWQVVDVVPFDEQKYPDCSPIFAPTGDRYLCYLMKDNQSLWLASLSKGLEKRLLSQATFEFIWSADGQHVIYMEDSYLKERNRPVSEPIHMLNIESGSNQIIGEATAKWRMQALPTGQVSFIDNDVIKLVSLDSQQRRNREETIPIWSDTNTRQSDETIDYWSHDLYHFDVWYQFSPDGHYLLLAKRIDFQVEVQLVDLASGERTTVTKLGKHLKRNLFSWASDSQRFIYLAMDEKDGRLPEIWMMDVVDKARQLVWQGADQGSYHNLTWKADDRLIFFDFLPSGTHTIPKLDYYIFDLEQNQPHLLVPKVANVNHFDDDFRLFIATSELVNNKIVSHYSLGKLVVQ